MLKHVSEITGCRVAAQLRLGSRDAFRVPLRYLEMSEETQVGRASLEGVELRLGSRAAFRVAFRVQGCVSGSI